MSKWQIVHDLYVSNALIVPERTSIKGPEMKETDDLLCHLMGILAKTPLDLNFKFRMFHVLVLLNIII